MTLEIPNDVPKKTAEEELKHFFKKITSLEKNKSDIAEDIKFVYDELKSKGYDPKAMRKVVRISKQNKSQVMEEQTMVEFYTDIILGTGED